MDIPVSLQLLHHGTDFQTAPPISAELESPEVWPWNQHFKQGPKVILRCNKV